MAVLWCSDDMDSNKVYALNIWIPTTVKYYLSFQEYLFSNTWPLSFLLWWENANQQTIIIIIHKIYFILIFI